MKHSNLSGKEKLRIVLEGIKGQVPLGKLARETEFSQAQYYKW